MKFDTLPHQCLVDEMLQIRVLGLRAGERLNLKLWSCFSDVVWRSEAVFLADPYGVVDLSTQAPVSGSYTGVDPMGLFWSRAPVLPSPPKAMTARARTRSRQRLPQKRTTARR